MSNKRPLNRIGRGAPRYRHQKHYHNRYHPYHYYDYCNYDDYDYHDYEWNYPWYYKAGHSPSDLEDNMDANTLDIYKIGFRDGWMAAMEYYKQNEMADQQPIQPEAEQTTEETPK